MLCLWLIRISRSGLTLRDKEVAVEKEIFDCPVCRSKSGVYLASDYGYFVCCIENCTITPTAHSTADEAISAWNSGIIDMRKRED